MLWIRRRWKLFEGYCSRRARRAAGIVGGSFTRSGKPKLQIAMNQEDRELSKEPVMLLIDLELWRAPRFRHGKCTGYSEWRWVFETHSTIRAATTTLSRESRPNKTVRDSDYLALPYYNRFWQTDGIKSRFDPGMCSMHGYPYPRSSRGMALIRHGYINLDFTDIRSGTSHQRLAKLLRMSVWFRRKRSPQRFVRLVGPSYPGSPLWFIPDRVIFISRRRQIDVTYPNVMASKYLSHRNKNWDWGLVTDYRFRNVTGTGDQCPNIVFRTSFEQHIQNSSRYP